MSEKLIHFIKTWYFRRKKFVKDLIPFIPNFLKFKRQSIELNRIEFEISKKDIKPYLFDNTENTRFDSHYVYFTSWAIRKLMEIKPRKHLDFGSSLFFVGSASSYFLIDFYDFRPAKLILSNLNCLPGNITNINLKDNSVDSLSSLHVIEHIGLVDTVIL